MNGTLSIHGELTILSDLAKKIDEWFPGALRSESQPDSWGGWTTGSMTVLLERVHPWQLLLLSFMAQGEGRRSDSEVRQRFALGESGLRGQTGAITKHIAKMVTEGIIPEDASPLVRVDRASQTSTFVMPQELVPVLLAALEQPSVRKAVQEARETQELDER